MKAGRQDRSCTRLARPPRRRWLRADDIPKLPLNLALLKGASIVGVFWGDFAKREPKQFSDSIRQLGRWHADGKLRPHVSQTFPLEKAVDALKLMAARQVKGKVVLTVGA